MATSIVSPSSMSVPGMDQIDNAFGNIYSMFGGKATGNNSGNVFGQPLSGGGSGPYGVSSLDPSNPNNVGMYSNLANLMGVAAPTLLSEGSNLVNTGMGVTSGGLDMSGAGFGATETGLATMQPSIDFYTRLASGDPTAMTEALAPSAAAASNIETNALAQNNQGIRGGYSAMTSAGLPAALASQVGTEALQLQPAALQQLAALGGEQAQIGGAQAGIGQGVSGVGQGIAGTGTTLTGQGTQTAQNTIADMLQKIGLNYQYGGPQTFATIMQGLGSLGSDVSAAEGIPNLFPTSGGGYSPNAVDLSDEDLAIYGL